MLRPGCSVLSKRRENIARVLDDQIKVAKRLSRDKSQFSMESRFAWEIVEELSQKLDKVSRQLETCVCEDREYYAKFDIDEALSVREYDC